ncbi:MAG: hypothetical protein K0S09_1499 [Sphingobacteriaceae bacterium]|jgi:hypothetical protein|nr:hypothetical protein [Sphingobacteriaceae bacterium]
MKKSFLGAILFLGLATAVSAQENKQGEKREHSKERAQASPEDRAQHMTDALAKRLSLSDAQKKQVYAINLENAQAMEKAHASSDKSKASKEDFSKRAEAYRANEAKILSVLNDSQKAEYNKMKADRPSFDGRRGEGEHGKDDRRGKDQAQRPDQGREQWAHTTPEQRAQRMTDGLSERLKLSDTQKKQVYQINLQAAQSMLNARPQGDQAKPSKEDFAKRTEAFRATEEKIMAVLTDAQKATYNQMKAERGQHMRQQSGK